MLFFILSLVKQLKMLVHNHPLINFFLNACLLALIILLFLATQMEARLAGAALLP